LQNEDANPNLVIIDPVAGTQTTYTFGPTPHGGGYDDMAFRNGNVFISASNPSNNPNTGPAIVKAEISGTSVSVSPVLLGDANATDVRTGKPVTLNLLDPDSMIFDPVGDLVLDSQSDAELIIVRHPGFTDQSVFHLGLTLGGFRRGLYRNPQFSGKTQSRHWCNYSDSHRDGKSPRNGLHPEVTLC
jgi:hypothetical protein